MNADYSASRLSHLLAREPHDCCPDLLKTSQYPLRPPYEAVPLLFLAAAWQTPSLVKIKTWCEALALRVNCFSCQLSLIIPNDRRHG